MTSAADINYANLVGAIELLGTAGGANYPSFAARNAVWNDSENRTLTLQILYMSLTALGMYMNFYGNAREADGDKGLGPGPNTCYLEYANPIIQAQLAALAGTCVGAVNSGHTGFGTAPWAGDGLTRACEGVMLFNTMLSSVVNISFPDDTGDLGNIEADVLNPTLALCTAALGPAPGVICGSTSIEECVTDRDR